MQDVEMKLVDIQDMMEDIGLELEVNEEDIIGDVEKVSIWVKDKEFFVPSTDISVVDKLPPGTYRVSNTNDRGLHCKMLSVETDDLYVFTDSVVKDLLDEIKTFWENKETYEKYKLVHKRGVLLSGYPGNGKTSIIDLISKELILKNGVIFKVDGPANFVEYLDFMKYGFKKIQPDTPTITILEDLEQFEGVESKLLDFLDGQNQFNHHLVIATSNNTSEIPDSFLRPSRIDLKIEIDYPSETTREEFYKFKGVSDDILKELVKSTVDCTFADLKEVFICHFVYGYTIEAAVNKVKNPLKKKDYSSFSNRQTKLGL